MSKLTFEDKINLYNDRKAGMSISSLCSKYKILHANVEYLTRLIDKHGYDVLRKNRNRKFTPYEKETKDETIKRLKQENLYLKAELEYSKKLRAVVQARKRGQQKKK